jgi:hypothetical protein
VLVHAFTYQDGRTPANRQRGKRRLGKFLGARIALQNACQKENERISTMPFLLSHFSPGDKIENCSAQFLAVCWTVHRVNRNEPIGSNRRFEFQKRSQLFISTHNERFSVAVKPAT